MWFADCSWFNLSSLHSNLVNAAVWQYLLLSRSAELKYTWTFNLHTSLIVLIGNKYMHMLAQYNPTNVGFAQAHINYNNTSRQYTYNGHIYFSTYQVKSIPVAYTPLLHLCCPSKCHRLFPTCLQHRSPPCLDVQLNFHSVEWNHHCTHYHVLV